MADAKGCAGMKAVSDLDAHKKALETELAELHGSSASTEQDRSPVTLDQQSIGRLSRMDAIQAQAMASAAETRRQQRIARIRSALSRMETGEFGYCLRCGDGIAEGRLRADPAATLCIDCARR